MKHAVNRFSIDIESIFHDIASHTLVLTPNHHSAVQLLEAFGEYSRGDRRADVLPSPAITPIDIWIRQTWLEYQSMTPENPLPGQLLTASQELLLWKDVIRQSGIQEQLLNLEATARKVQEAYRLIQQWQIPLAEIRAGQQGASPSLPFDDQQLFQDWMQAFRNRLAHNSLFTLSTLIQNFSSSLAVSPAEYLPKKIILAGFSNPPPLYEKLLGELRKNTSCQNFSSAGAPTGNTDIFAAQNEAQEMIAAAQWASEISGDDPAARVGIICPDIHSRFTEAERTFSSVFAPRRQFSFSRTPPKNFSISGGERLADLPLIATALSILELHHNHIQTLDICALLRSPFIQAAESEAEARAELEFRLRKNREQQHSLNRIRSLAQQTETRWYCPVLGKALQSSHQLSMEHRSARECMNWSGYIEQQLKLFGWPGERPLNESESEQLENWYQLLAEFSRNSFLFTRMDIAEALDILGQLARHQQQNHHFFEAPVQVLSPVEADGLCFSHTWIMGMSEQNWPPQNRPNPFIPLPLQKKYRLPDAMPELQFETSKQMLEGFLSRTTTLLVFSYPLQQDDLSTAPTPAIIDFQTQTGQKILPPESELHPYASATALQQDLDLLQDEIDLPLRQTDAVSGGISLIADQAACPFRSFARHRLKSRELPALYYGLPPEASGNMLHMALEILWKQLGSLSALDNRDEVERQVLSSVETTLQEFVKKYPDTLSPRYLALEQKRLTGLIRNWLSVELDRGSFSVAGLEHPLQWRHANLQLDFRIDRIDRDNSGRTVLVDYKSSRGNTVNWLDQRQDRPQLLLYLLAAEQQQQSSSVSGILYAQVNIEDMRYYGISEDDSVYPGTALAKQKKLPQELSWEALKQIWQTSLQELAEQFLSGYLAVDPKGPQTCQYCHLSSLCRIQEQGSLR